MGTKRSKSSAGGVTVHDEISHRDAYRGLQQDPSEYLTTEQLATELGVDRTTVHKWCRGWFGRLPQGRIGAGLGYRIPHEYGVIARAWVQTHDAEARQAIELALRSDPEASHKKFLVQVANLVSSHYSVDEAMERAGSLVDRARAVSKPVHIYYVGRRKFDAEAHRIQPGTRRAR